MNRKNSEYHYNINSMTIANRFANLLLLQGKKNNAYRLLINSITLVEKFLESKHNRAIRATEPEQALKKANYQQKKTNKKAEHLNMISNTIREQLCKQGPQIKKVNAISTSQQVCLQVVNYTKPCVETRKVRKGGTVYQVPYISSNRRKEGIAIRWLINVALAKNATSKKRNTFSERLAEEILSTFQKSSQSRQKREELHNLAALNRSNTRYRWW